MKNLLKNTLIDIKEGRNQVIDKGDYLEATKMFTVKEAKELDKQLEKQRIKGLKVKQAYISGIAIEVYTIFAMNKNSYICPTLNEEEQAFEERKKAYEEYEKKFYSRF